MQDPFAGSLLDGWRVNAPAGVTPRGNVHRFQQATVEELNDIAERLAGQAYQELVETIESNFPEGNSEYAGYERAVDSLDYQVRSSRAGVSVEFTMGAKHAVYMTSLRGGPQDVALIKPRRGKYLRFYWKNPPPEVGPPKVYMMKSVLWRPRVRGPGEDPIAETLGAYANAFGSAMLEAHDRAWVEFMSERVQYDVGSRSSRVGLAV